MSGSETLLLVEDDSAARTAAQRGLERLGYTVLEARDGEEALAILDTGKGSAIALIVSDFVMPVMSGLEMAKAVSSRFPGIPVIIRSGYPDTDIDLPPSLERDTLGKPYDLIRLGALIRKMIDGKGE